jgi:hypothetical protein
LNSNSANLLRGHDRKNSARPFGGGSRAPDVEARRGRLQGPEHEILVMKQWFRVIKILIKTVKYLIFEETP